MHAKATRTRGPLSQATSTHHCSTPHSRARSRVCAPRAVLNLCASEQPTATCCSSGRTARARLRFAGCCAASGRRPVGGVRTQSHRPTRCAATLSCIRTFSVALTAPGWQQPPRPAGCCISRRRRTSCRSAIWTLRSRTQPWYLCFRSAYSCSSCLHRGCSCRP